MIYSKIFPFAYLFLLISIVSKAQSTIPSANVSFEKLTGKTLYQSINYYKLRFQAEGFEGVSEELDTLFLTIKQKESPTLKSDFYFLNTIVDMKNRNLLENYRYVNIYKEFVSNHSINKPYKAKLKLLEAYCHFFNGTWATSLKLFQASASLAKKEKDLITQLNAELYHSYIISFTIDEVKGLDELKNLYQKLKNNTYPNFFQKDLNLLKVDISERFFRYYRIQKPYELDTLIKYNTIHTNEILNIKDDLALSKMYLMEAYIATRLHDDEKAKLNLQKALRHPLDYYNQLLLSDIYYLQGKFKESISIIENSNFIKNLPITNTPSCPLLNSEFLSLANSYRQLGDFKKSNQYYDNHVVAFKSFTDILNSVSSTIKKKEITSLSKELNDLKSKKHKIKYQLLVSFTVVTGLIGIFLFYYFKNRKNVPELTQQLPSKKNASPIKKEIIEHILIGLKKLEKEQYYLNKECNAYNTAKRIKTNTSYLSIVINSHYQKNFNSYINDLRIHFVLEKLQNDKRFRLYSIQSIAEEIGYKSSDSFAKYFKQHTGLLPSSYIKSIS
ncbi:helix-turn-helix domain-containing protein [uncultured Tenacibaculum sp.]|uniref:helix-turn-helix domain-containing protein n=1 Tax=uncultured Tenacibaculum sp. TaxID=174713 RepID=UPI00262A3DA0|nr:helix-turn-helix domain-containing protein [uncultured Tenacibaculum sp.]